MVAGLNETVYFANSDRLLVNDDEIRRALEACIGIDTIDVSDYPLDTTVEKYLLEKGISPEGVVFVNLFFGNKFFSSMSVMTIEIFAKIVRAMKRVSKLLILIDYFVLHADVF